MSGVNLVLRVHVDCPGIWDQRGNAEREVSEDPLAILDPKVNED